MNSCKFQNPIPGNKRGGSGQSGLLQPQQKGCKRNRKGREEGEGPLERSVGQEWGIQMGSPIVRKETLLFLKTRAGPTGRKEYGGGFRKEPERKRKSRWKKRKKS